MKCYHELPCTVLQDIQSQSLAYFNSIYDFRDQQSLNTDLWLKIHTRDFLKSSPALLLWVRELGLHIRETALTIVNDSQGAILHIDELPVTAKINIPLLNYQGVINEWWSVPDYIMKSVTPVINQFGQPYYNLEDIDLTLCTLEASIEMTGPIVFNSQKPHRVVVSKSAKFPRVILSCMFRQEPTSYLE
jgi:hypothetical protein